MLIEATAVAAMEFAIKADRPARVRSAVAPMHPEPRVSAAQVSQVVAGNVVQPLEVRGDWCNVRSPDGYAGWMHSGYLEPASGHEGSWRVSVGAVVSDISGQLRALPINARVDDTADVVSGAAVAPNDLRATFPATPEAIAGSATRLFHGASYLWGGVTEWGCDCSGLVQSVFTLHGCALPRDAYQQAECGDPVRGAVLHSTGATGVVEGDLLFFSDREDRRITHVGIMLAGARMVHSALGRGGVHVEDLQSEEEYVQRLRRNFVAARRACAS